MSAQTASAKRGRFQGLWALQEFWTDKVQLRKAAIDKFITPILLDAIQKKNENEKGQGDDVKVSEEDTLLSQLLKVTDGTSRMRAFVRAGRLLIRVLLDYNIIHDETLNILLAGRDTTACTLTFAIYRLAEHPDILKRLREEILDVVGSNRRPSYDDVRNMKFLRAVINETLRLYPPV